MEYGRFVSTRQTPASAAYSPLTLASLGQLLAVEADERTRFRLVLEFLEEYRWERPVQRRALLAAPPLTTGDQHWDVLLAGLAEHLTAADGIAAPGWATGVGLDTWWFLDDTPAGRAEALITAPAALRRRGVFLAAADLTRA